MQTGIYANSDTNQPRPPAGQSLPTTNSQQPTPRRDHRLPSRLVPPILDASGKFRSTAKWTDQDWERPLQIAVERASGFATTANVRLGFPPGHPPEITNPAFLGKLYAIEREMERLRAENAMFLWREQLQLWEFTSKKLIESFEI